MSVFPFEPYGGGFPTWGMAIGGKDGAGNFQPFAIDTATGKLLILGSFTSTPVSSSTVSAAGPTTVGTSPVTLLAANASRLRFSLQNVGTTRIWILFGAGTPSSSNYHIALPAGGVADDGSSPIFLDTLWLGLVQAISASAGGRVAVAENTA